MRISLLLVALVLVGCAFTGERNPVPKGSVENAVIAGIPEARFWGDETIKTWVREAGEVSGEEYRRRNIGIMNREHDYLALSGGSANGAFGAGLLKGWTTRGDRPSAALASAQRAPASPQGSVGQTVLPEVRRGRRGSETLKYRCSQIT